MKFNQDKLYQRVAASFATGIRGDITIADFQKLDGQSAHVLLEFSPTMGRPSADDVERYFAKTFESRVLPVMSSLSMKPRCVSIVATMNVPTRSFEETADKSKMTPVIAGTIYLDNQLQDVWEVKQDSEGKKILAKQTKENIEQLIAARRNRTFVTESPSVSLSSVNQARKMIGSGAIVQCWHAGESKLAEVVEKVQAGFRVKDQAGKEFIVAETAVVDLKKMADAAPNEDAALLKYYSEAYGDPKYSKELVKTK